jgi:hypothetical protein
VRYSDPRAEIRELREHVERLQQRLAAARERYILESEDLRQRYEALVDHCTAIAATQPPAVITLAINDEWNNGPAKGGDSPYSIPWATPSTFRHDFGYRPRGTPLPEERLIDQRREAVQLAYAERLAKRKLQS